MNKPVVVILSLLVGGAIGFMLGREFPAVPALQVAATQITAPQEDHFYYFVNDTTITRHTITHSEGTTHHSVDTIAVKGKE